MPETPQPTLPGLINLLENAPINLDASFLDRLIVDAEQVKVDEVDEEDAEDDETDWETVMDQSEDEKTQHHEYQEKYLDDSDDEVSCGGGMCCAQHPGIGHVIDGSTAHSST